MKKINSNKFKLRTETLRDLETAQLRQVGGGEILSVPINRCQTTKVVWCGETAAFECAQQTGGAA